MMIGSSVVIDILISCIVICLGDWLIDIFIIAYVEWCMVDTLGLEPNLSSCKEDAFPIMLAAHYMEGEEGFEPSIYAGVKSQCLNQLGDSLIKSLCF